MSRESTDDVKRRLLDDPEVHWMISRRAYEIYQMRGGQGGNAADDWFRAESEVLAFLIAEEDRRAAEERSASSPETVAGVELVSRTDETAEPETSIGAWSATEPAGLELAPALGGEAAMETPVKTRSASKTATPRAKKTGDDIAKKTAATTTRRAAPKKSADAPDKPKRTRKKTDTTQASE